MKRREMISAGVATLCVPSSGIAVAQGQKADAPPKSDLALCDDLLSKNITVRQFALIALGARRSELVDSLLANLQAQSKAPDTNFQGSFQYTVLALGDLRATEAVITLVELVDTRLTGNPPGGGFGGPQFYYPAAQALAKIGGLDVTNRLLWRMSETVDDELIRVATWVLLQANTEPVARFIIQQKLDRVKTVLKNIGITDTNPETRNLERMIAVLDSKQPILPPEGDLPVNTAHPAPPVAR